MASNIIQLISDQLGNSFAGAIASITGLAPEQTRKMVSVAVPALLAAILGAARTSTGSAALASTLQTQDPDLLSRLPSWLSGSNQQSLSGSGVDTLASLLGESKLGALTSALSSFGGINRGVGRSMLGLLAPVVMGVLGQQQRAGNLDINGLTRLLEDQKQDIASALPSSLATSLDSAGVLGGVGDAVRGAAGRTAGAAATGAATVATAADSTRRRGGTWAALAVGLAVLVLIVWAVNHFAGTPAVEQASQTVTKTASTAASMMVGDVDVGKEFTTFTEGLTQTMKSVTDEVSAKAALPKLTELTAKLDSLAPLVGQLPTASKTAFADIVKTTIASLQTEVDRVSSISGVSDTIKPVLDGLKGKLEALVA